MSEPIPRPDPDAWLDDVRRWYFGGTPPLNYADSELPPPAAPETDQPTLINPTRTRP